MLLLCLLFSLLTQNDHVQLSCLLPDGRSGPFMVLSILKIQEITIDPIGKNACVLSEISTMVNVFYFYHNLELYKPHLDTAR